MPMNAAELSLVRDLVFRQAGIVLDTGKDYLIEARISALAKKLSVESSSDLVNRMKRATDELTRRAVVDAMTTNETSFFRDIHPFEALRKNVIPDLMARNAATKKLSIWCAASSTGQEPYTLAMQLREHFPALKDWKVTFIASDLSREVLARAKAGKYGQLEVNRGLPATMLVKYFKKVGPEWEINADLRQMIDFREINLLETWPAMPALDLVFIRNVLIYFDQDTKKRILSRIRGLMQPHGYLFLGGAETTMNLDDNFEREQLDKAGCYRLRGKSAIAA